MLLQNARLMIAFKNQNLGGSSEPVRERLKLKREADFLVQKSQKAGPAKFERRNTLEKGFLTNLVKMALVVSKGKRQLAIGV